MTTVILAVAALALVALVLLGAASRGTRRAWSSHADGSTGDVSWMYVGGSGDGCDSGGGDGGGCD
jgi:hypothetical protein